MDFLRLDLVHIFVALLFCAIMGYFVVRNVRACRSIQNRESENTYRSRALCIIRSVSLAGASAFLMIALLGPTAVWTTGSEHEGSEIVWLLDVSRSMDVRDIRTDTENISRLERAKSLIGDFMIAHPEHRYGLVIFAGQARIVSPLTTSTDSILTFLGSTDSASISEGGSDFEKVTELTTQRFTASGRTSNSRAFILLSDGGDKEDAPDETTIRNLFHGKTTRLSTVGFGSSEWGPIPIGTDPFGGTVYKEQNGQTVVSAISEDNLRSLARAGGGSYLSDNDPDTDLSSLVKDLSKQIIRSTGDGSERDIGRYFVILSIPFILIALAPDRRRKSPARIHINSLG